MICALCNGAGSRFTLQCGRQWWPCQPCGGTGSRIQCSPAEIALASAQTKFMRPENAPSVGLAIAGGLTHG